MKLACLTPIAAAEAVGGDKRMKKLITACVGLAMMGMAGTAQATLIGDTIFIKGGFTSHSGLTVVDPGAEYTESYGAVTETVDVFASSFTLTLQTFETGSFDADASYELGYLDWFDASVLGVISGVYLSSAATQSGVTVSGLSYYDTLGTDSGHISFETSGAMIGGAGGATSEWLFEITATHGTPVPEPSTLAIFLVGLAGLGFVTRRRRTGVGDTRRAS